MTKIMEQLLKDALCLTDAERAELAGYLLHSLEQQEDEDVASAWDAEIARRVSDMNDGKVTLVPWSVVRQRLQSHDQLMN